MARINIEECWWSDPRRMKLIELVGTFAADGVAINAWRLAQEFWSKGELVPLSIWQHLQANAKLIEANLAEMREEGVYVRGSSQYLDWVRERRRAAAEGGRKSAQKRSKTKQTDQANGKQTQANVNQTQPSGSGSGSYSGSSSYSGVSARAPVDQVNSAEDLKKKIPIVHRSAWENALGGPVFDEQVEKAWKYHTADPTQQPRTSGQWMKKLITWFEIYEQKNPKQRTSAAVDAEIIANWEKRDGVSQ